MFKRKETRRLIGWIIIGLMIFAAIVCNGFWSKISVYALLYASWVMPLVYCIIGVIIAQPIIMAVWLTLGCGKAYWRAITCVGLGLIFVTAWYLSLNLERVDDAFYRDGYFLVAFLPVTFVSCTIPMLIARYVGMRRFTSSIHEDEAIERLTIVDMMTATALIGLAISVARMGWNYADNHFYMSGGEMKQLMIGVLIACGISYVVGIVSTIACIFAARASILTDVLLIIISLLTSCSIFCLLYTSPSPRDS